MSSEYQRNYNMNVLSQRLVYNKDNYDLTILPVTTSAYNMFLNFKDRYIDNEIKLVLVNFCNQMFISFREPSNIQYVDNLFNKGAIGALDKEILNKIEMIYNQIKFVNYFLFGDREHYIGNNYNSVDFKINTPKDLLTFSKDLYPFKRTNCLDVHVMVKFMLTEDFSTFNTQFTINARIDGNVYTGAINEVINELLVAYACNTLEKKLAELTLRDHVLLKMVKI